jgi:arabinofuranan 3-O-arabinosyltransferase
VTAVTVSDSARPDGPNSSGPDVEGDGDRRTGVVGLLRRVQPGVVLLVLVSYVPLLFTAPGKVGADTKTYLYLDPSRLMSRAAFMWDTNIGLGTVTHQNIGYLWPMGPYYWLMEAIGLPDWVAQRLWIGSVILAAGLGVRWMLRELHWSGTGVTVASFAYALSPYLLHYEARISVILLPFAGLPWLIGLASRSVRTGGWRAPALFALVTVTVGGINATSIALVMIAPVLWLVHATFVAKECTFRQALAAGLRISFLTLVTSFWWMAGLVIQGSYGIPILRYTESYYVVANAALAPELLRGLGYWFFYGRDGLGAWIQPAITMVQSIPALVLSYALPILAFAGGLLSRFRNRGYFAALAVIGLVISVGAHPWDSSSPYGALFKSWTRTEAGLAFRSTPRAVPLIALTLAVFLGAGCAAVSRWRPKLHVPVAAALIVLICLNQSGLFLGRFVDRNLQRDEDVPSYWLEAAAYLDEGDFSTRVYEMPGSDFASYRWGATVDPITPGLMDREYVARELIPYGTPGSANLLNEYDVPVQEGRFDPDTFAPIARLLGVGQILHRADLQYERYRTPRPRTLQDELLRADGLDEPTTFGEPRPNTPTSELPLDDEAEFATPNDLPDPAPVSVFPVEDPRPTIRSVQAFAPVVLAGDAAGIVALASAGRLQVDRPLFESASFVDDPERLRSIVDEPDSELVVTDTNRRAARRWGSVRENDGYTERAGETPIEDPADNRLDLFPGSGDDERTIAIQRPAGLMVDASNYGNPVSYTAGDRALFAFDGDDSTAWKVGAFADVEGEHIDLHSEEPITADRLTLLQTQKQANRWMTVVRLGFDCDQDDRCASEERVELTDASRLQPGQEITFDRRTFHDLRITIEDTNLGKLARYTGVSDVGFASIRIPGVPDMSEIVRPPTDLLDVLGASSLDRPLSWIFTRRSALPTDLLVNEPEPRLERLVLTPVARRAVAYGKARMSTRIPDVEVDRLVGLPDASQGSLTATADRHLPGDLRSRAASSVDGDPTTAWQTPVNGSQGATVEITYGSPVSFDHLPITVITDGRHSVPKVVSLSVDGGDPILLDLGDLDLGDGSERGATTTVDVPTGEVTGTSFRFTIEELRERPSKDWFSGTRTVTPLAVAEWGLPVTRPALPEDTPLDDRCRDDLVEIDGTPVPLRVIGTVGAALDHDLLRLEACGDPVSLREGSNELRSAPGPDTGFDVDLLALSSAAGGGPGVDSLVTPLGDGPTPPATAWERNGRLEYEVRVTDAESPYWLILGQSLSPGWTATVDGRDLGEPTLINGYANGWRVDPSEVGGDATIVLKWTPQRWVTVALWASLVGALLCVGLVIRPVPWLARRRSPEGGGSPVLPAAPMVPVGIPPLGADGDPLPVARALGGAALIGLVAVLAMGPAVGAAVAVVAAVALGLRRGQAALRVVCLGAFGTAAAYIVLKEARAGYVVDFDWMNKFELTHAWGLTAAALLAVDPLVEVLRRRDAAGTGGPATDAARADTDPPSGTPPADDADGTDGQA